MSLAPDSQAVLEPLTLDDAGRCEAYVQLLDRNRPSLPLGFLPAQSRNYNRYYAYSYSMDRARPDATLRWSVLEREIEQLGKPTSERIYCAVTSGAPDFVRLGVSAAQQQAGIHVVRGVW
jgi:hypothetical protein